MSSDPIVDVRGVRKSFGTVRALDGFDLVVRRGTLLALLGPSGCGKTTALRVVAGFERPDAGEVHIDGRAVAGAGAWEPPHRRRVGMVFQDWALFPHLTVAQNIAFGVRGSRGQRRGRIEPILAAVRLDGLGHRMPHELSGGQQQRVALARAMAASPRMILLDEPFSNLDAALREEVRAEVRQLLHDHGITAIVVTHDQEEALSIADEVAVMANGRILQTGSPGDVYETPATRQVATLLGKANLLPASIHAGRAITSIGMVPAPGASGAVDVLIRPESIHLRPDPAGPGTVTDIEFFGHDQLVHVRLDDGSPLQARPFGPRPDLTIGARVGVELTGPVHVLATNSNGDGAKQPALD